MKVTVFENSKPGNPVLKWKNLIWKTDRENLFQQPPKKVFLQIPEWKSLSFEQKLKTECLYIFTAILSIH